MKFLISLVALSFLSLTRLHCVDSTYTTQSAMGAMIHAVAIVNKTPFHCMTGMTVALPAVTVASSAFHCDVTVFT